MKVDFKLRPWGGIEGGTDRQTRVGKYNDPWFYLWTLQIIVRISEGNQH